MECKISRCMQILVSYAWKSRFGIIFASIATSIKLSGIYSAFYIVTGLFDWLWYVFMVFNVILLLFVNHLKDFFVIYRLPDDWYYPWNHGRIYDLRLDFFQQLYIYIYESRYNGTQL